MNLVVVFLGKSRILRLFRLFNVKNREKAYFKFDFFVLNEFFNLLNKSLFNFNFQMQLFSYVMGILFFIRTLKKNKEDKIIIYKADTIQPKRVQIIHFSTIHLAYRREKTY